MESTILKFTKIQWNLPLTFKQHKVSCSVLFIERHQTHHPCRAHVTFFVTECCRISKHIYIWRILARRAHACLKIIDKMPQKLIYKYFFQVVQIGIFCDKIA